MPSIKTEQVTADLQLSEALWTLTPNWACPHCKTVNLAIREFCRTCGYDSNAGEFPWYNPLPPYDGLDPFEFCCICGRRNCRGHRP